MILRQIRKVFVLLLVMAAAFVLKPQIAIAHEGELHVGTQQTHQQDPNPIDAYEYTVKSGDNLTLLVRKSLQLYAQDKNIELGSAAALYCETGIVRQLGSRLLDVGEKVRIPFDVLQDCLVRSRNLTDQQRRAWSAYIPAGGLQVDGIEPRNITAARAANLPQTSSTSIEKKKAAEQPVDNSEWPYGLIIGSVVFLGVYFALDMSKNNSQSKAKTVTIKRSWSNTAVPATRQGRTKKGTVNTKNKQKRS